MGVVVRATLTWAGPRNEVVTLLSTTPGGDYLAAPADDPDVTLYRRIDEHDEPEGPVVGIEIIDFLTFDRWDALPKHVELWQLRDREPLPLDALLRREQQRFRQRMKVVA